MEAIRFPREESASCFVIGAVLGGPQFPSSMVLLTTTRARIVLIDAKVSGPGQLAGALEHLATTAEWAQTSLTIFPRHVFVLIDTDDEAAMTAARARLMQCSPGITLLNNAPRLLRFRIEREMHRPLVDMMRVVREGDLLRALEGFSAVRSEAAVPENALRIAVLGLISLWCAFPRFRSDLDLPPEARPLIARSNETLEVASLRLRVRTDFFLIL
jgi:hypothetical protein